MKIEDMDIIEIQKYQNSRYPCLLLDRVTEVIPGKFAKGYKNFTFNEYFFPAHFSDDPNVPSSIQIEAMSQILLMTFLTMPGNAGKNTACLKINNAEFKKKVIPGDRLELEGYLKTFRGGLAIGNAVGYIKGENEVNEKVCSADFIIGIPEILKTMAPVR